MKEKKDKSKKTSCLQNSDADFFFVVSSVNFMVPHIGGGGVKFDEANKDDAWGLATPRASNLTRHLWKTHYKSK